MSTRYYFAVIVICFGASGHPISSDVFLLEHSFPFYTRKDWGAAPATDISPLKTPVPFVVIHHTYIPAACHTFAQCSADMRSMQSYHQSLDWGDIGYNFAVGSDGGAYEGRGWEVVGIHARRANNFSLGVVLIGDWRDQLPPATQLATTKALIARGVRLGYVSPQYQLIGHRQATPTECPGEALLNQIATWDHYTAGNVTF